MTKPAVLDSMQNTVYWPRTLVGKQFSVVRGKVTAVVLAVLAVKAM